MAPKYLKTRSDRILGPAAAVVGEDIQLLVENIINDIASNGDAAVRSYSVKLDNWDPESFKLSPLQISNIISSVDPQIIQEIKTVLADVRIFAQAQRESVQDFEIEADAGVFLGQKNIPIERVGAYIPGGHNPRLSSAHMTILTAKVAGVKHVIGCTPPIAGAMPKENIAAMHLAGCDEIFVLGGVQAIAAMALGTESIGKVDFITGPRNALFAEAKGNLSGEVDIDLVAGSTEIVVIADDSTDPLTVATSLVAHAELGPDAPAVLITTSQALGEQALQHVDACLAHLWTKSVATVSWRDYGEVIVVGDMDKAYALADKYASENVEILTRQPREALGKLFQHGALFLGKKTGERTRYSGGLWAGQFLKTVTYQEVIDNKPSGEPND